MKQSSIFLGMMMLVIFPIVKVHSLLANYNIVEDMSLTVSSNTLNEGEDVLLTVKDSNVEDTKIIISLDENMELLESNNQDGSVLLDIVNHQLVIDWFDSSKENKMMVITLKITQKGSYGLQARTLREEQEVVSKENVLKVLNPDKAIGESSNLENTSTTKDTKIDESAVEKRENSYGVSSGKWGTSSWSFDLESGVMSVGPGELVYNYLKPWENDYYFKKESIKKIVFSGKVIAPENCTDLFKDLINVIEVEGLSNLDTSQVTSMRRMFSGMKNVQKLDVSRFDTSQVTRMDMMFSTVGSVQELDVSHFDTSQVQDMSLMFLSAKSVQELDVSHFDTSKVTDMSNMFDGVKSVQKLDISNFDTSQVMRMDGMFMDMKSVKELNVSHFDTSKVDSMIMMFRGVKSLEYLDLSSFTTNKDVSTSGILRDTFFKKLKLGENFRFGGRSNMPALESPIGLNEDDQITGKWVIEGVFGFPGYTPREMDEKYGYCIDENLIAGTYVAETIRPGEITAETKVSNKTHSDGLFYVNDEVKLENTAHNNGEIWNYTYETVIPKELTFNKNSYKGYVVSNDGKRSDLPNDVFEYDESRRILEVNLKTVSESLSESFGQDNYYSVEDFDVYYELTATINQDAIGLKFQFDTTLNYFNNVFEPKPKVEVSTENQEIYGLEPQWRLTKKIENVSRPDEVAAVGDELEFTITATNNEDLGSMSTFDISEKLFPKELDFVSGSAELLLPNGTTQKLDDSVYQPEKHMIIANVFLKSGLVGVEPYSLRFKAKINESGYGKILETKANLNGLTQNENVVNIDGDSVKINVVYSGKLGFKEAPKTLSFKDSFISVFTSTIERKEEDWGISIEDTRVQKEPWTLSVKQANPFESIDGDELTQVLIFRKNTEEDKGIDLKNEVNVYSENNLNLNDYFISWKKNEGFFLKVPPGTAKAKQYQTELQWNLKNTPI